MAFSFAGERVLACSTGCVKALRFGRKGAIYEAAKWQNTADEAAKWQPRKVRKPTRKRAEPPP